MLIIKTDNADTVRAIHTAGLTIKLVDKTSDRYVWVYSVAATANQVKAVAANFAIANSVHVSLVSVETQLADGIYIATQSGYEVQVSGQTFECYDGLRGSRTLYVQVLNGRVHGFFQ